MVVETVLHLQVLVVMELLTQAVEAVVLVNIQPLVETVELAALVAMDSQVAQAVVAQAQA